MKTVIKVFESIKQMVTTICHTLHFDTLFKNKTGRTLALPIEEIIALSLFKQKFNIATKKSVYDMFEPDCSYKTLVVNMNRWSFLALIVLNLIMKQNRQSAHFIKHIDSTNIPVCLFKNANSHATMHILATFGRSSKGTFYGLKLHLLTDLYQQFLNMKFTSGNVDDRKVVMSLASNLLGFFFADAGYVSEKLSKQFYQENGRILFAKPKKNMKKLMTKLEELLYRTRTHIETNFRNLKCFYGLVTSLPRSVNGYLANYIYSLLAYQLV
jgi:hypothetical protein